MSDRARVVGATLFFLAFWVLVYGGASVVSGHVPWRVPVALPGEPWVPLVPSFSVVYLSLGGLLLLAPAVLRTWDAVRPLFRLLIAQTVIAAACFVLIPARAEPWLDPAPQGLVMTVADTINLERNYFPSLHVTYSWTAALAIGRHGGRPVAAFAWAWALGITAATLLLHQHYVLDVVAGIGLAVGGWRWQTGRA